MEGSLAYLSVLAIPLLMGLGVIGFLTFQILRDRRREGADKKRLGNFIFAVIFWLLFVGYFIWRAEWQ